MRKKKEIKLDQLPLLSNIPYSLSIPSRATTKQENDFMVAIRSGIQDFIRQGGDYAEPIDLIIDLKQIAKEKGVVRWESLQRSYQKTLALVQEFPLTQTIKYISSEGNKMEETFWMLDSIKQDKTNGIIRVRVAQSFQQYYVSALLRSPEIQIDAKFHETAKSSYTYPFVNWLSAQVAVHQRAKREYPFHISVSLEDMQLHVPPGKEGMRPGDYMRNAIFKAIEDINTNIYSQLYIENGIDIISRTEQRRIVEFTFIVSFRDRTPENHVSLMVGEGARGLVDDEGIPSWTYLQERMLALGYGKSSIPQWENRRAKVWRTLLLTWVQISKLRRQGATDINMGGYLQTMLKQSLPPTPFGELAQLVILNAPEFRDSVVDACASFRVEVVTESLFGNDTSIEKQTPENNAFLKEYLKRKERLSEKI